MERFRSTERIGVNEVEKIFLGFGWIPRTIFQSDVGLDMEVEICNEGNPTGQLIGVQIKSGESFFKKDTAGDIIYRGSLVHLDYWLKHSLPIILVLHNPNDGVTIWQKIEEGTVRVTPKGWKTEIPSSQILDENHKKEIESHNKYPIYFQRLQRLAVHKELMAEVHEGNDITVEVSFWANKTIGKATIQVIRVEPIVKETLLLQGNYIYFKAIESLYFIFPWADFEVDEDYYEEEEHESFLNEFGIWDPEDKEYIGSTISYNEFRSTLPKIRSLEAAGGEINFYRLKFSLNDLGKSFLVVNNFLDNMD